MPHAYDLRIAGLHLRILAPRSVELPDNLQPFLTHDCADHDPDWTFEVYFGSKNVSYTDSDKVRRFQWKEGEYFFRIVPFDRPRTCRLFAPEGIADMFCINANWTLYLMVEQLILPYQRVILHSSAVMHEGEAILFTAPSGTGKSTQASLWETHLDAEIINGDKVIVSADEKVPIAYGGPIAGTSGIHKNIQAPVKAIVYLHQGNQNELRPLDKRHAFMALYSQAVKSPSDAAFNEALIPIIAKIVDRVPVVDYSCLPDVSAVENLRIWLSHASEKQKSEENL
jgi:hypothetical protein